MFRLLKFILKFLVGCILFGAVIAIGGYLYYSKDLPDVAELKDVRLQTPMLVYSADGELIATFGERRRIPLKYEDIPKNVIDAVIATEDSRFYSHHGIDPIGIMRAIFIALKSGHLSQGGSTITQQVAKNFFLTPKKDISRKIREMILAVRMEKELTKEEIITLYLNKIYFGSRSYGIGSAAFTFFGKSAKDITLSEAALLAGLPNAPSSYNPIAYPERATIRRNWVLHRMLDENYITQAQYDTAIKEPLNVSYHLPKIAFKAPYIAEMARQFMYEKFGEKAYTDGFKVTTTAVHKNQVAANESVRKAIFDYDMRHGYRGPQKVLWKADATPLSAEEIKSALNQFMDYGELKPAVVMSSQSQSATAVLRNGDEITIPYAGVKWARKFINDSRQGTLPKSVNAVLKPGQQIWVRKVADTWWLSQVPSVNGALVSIDTETGAIKALVGGFDFSLSKFNRATQAFRQIGSNIKPFIYTAALEKGLTMATILNDAPILRTSAGSEAWRPKNSPPEYDGPLRLRIGLAESKNVMMVRAVRAIGVDYAADYLHRFGFPDGNISRTESLALGAASFTPLQVVRAYATIANGGYLIKPYFIQKIEYAEGGTLYEHKPVLICRECDQPEPEEQDGGITALNDDDIENAIQSNQQDEPNPLNPSADDSLQLPQAQTGEQATLNTHLPSTPEQPIYAPHVINSGLAFIMKDALKSVVWGVPNDKWRGTAWRSRSLGRHDVGGKTGTTNLSKDVWFSGFGGNLATTVWIGFDDHRRELGRAHESLDKEYSYVFSEGGARTANPLWNDYMKEALQDVPETKDEQPSNVVSVVIDKKTGLLGYAGPSSVKEYFIEGTEPTTYPRKEIGTQIMDDFDGSTSELF